MTVSGVITSARVTHRTGSVDELAAVSPETQYDAVAELRAEPAIEEAFVLSTCNRVEAYVVASDADDGRTVLEEFFAGAAADAVTDAGHEGSLRHLLRVTCGLESVVLGEDQIIGQVRDAFEDARCAGGIGPTLETAVTKAIHVGERARTETAINEGIVSLGSAAATVAAEEVGLDGSTALVVGAGEMGALAARCLANHGAAAVVVANRTVDNAAHVRSELDVDGDAVALDALEDVVTEAEVVVTATGSPDPLLEPAHLGDREQVVIDLGQPRDVDPAAKAVPGVTVYDLDDLESITSRTREDRAAAAAEVETMIDREHDRLLEQYKRTRADEVIAAMYESAERIKERELETAFARLEDDDEFTERQREIVRAMTDALVGQLLAPPTESLREAAAEDDWNTIDTALQLFDPEFGPEPLASALDADVDSDRPIGATDDD